MRKESGAWVVLAYNRHIKAGHDRRSRLKGVALVRRDDTFDLRCFRYVSGKNELG